MASRQASGLIATACSPDPLADLKVTGIDAAGCLGNRVQTASLYPEVCLKILQYGYVLFVDLVAAVQPRRADGVEDRTELLALGQNLEREVRRVVGLSETWEA